MRRSLLVAMQRSMKLEHVQDVLAVHRRHEMHPYRGAAQQCLAVVARQHLSALVGRQVLAGRHRCLGAVELVVTDLMCGHQA